MDFGNGARGGVTLIL